MKIRQNLSKYFKSKAGAYTLMGAMLTPTWGGAGYTLYDVISAHDSGSNPQSQTQMHKLEDRAQDIADMGVRLKAVANVAQSQTDLEAAMEASDTYSEMRKDVEAQANTLFADIINNEDLTEEDMRSLIVNTQDLFRSSSSLEATATNDFMQASIDHRHYRYAQECAVDLKMTETKMTPSTFDACTGDYRETRVMKLLSVAIGNVALTYAIVLGGAPLSNRIGNGINNIGRRRKSKLGMN